MTRWHLLRNGRIVRSVTASDGESATAALRPAFADWVCSDVDWWAMQHRRALRPFPPTWNPFRAETATLATRQGLPRVSV